MSYYTDDLHSLSHTKWNCKYHIVLAPKYRRKEFYDARRIEIGKILRQLCEWKGVNIISKKYPVNTFYSWAFPRCLRRSAQCYKITLG